MYFTVLLWQGMDLVESLNHIGFNGYLKQYHNTICGRHPIGVLLGVSLTLVSTTDFCLLRNGSRELMGKKEKVTYFVAVSVIS